MHHAPVTGIYTPTILTIPSVQQLTYSLTNAIYVTKTHYQCIQLFDKSTQIEHLIFDIFTLEWLVEMPSL